ncbi:MAG TPA: 3-isopropylmalate dehydratase small subunit [Verrucomicrobia bacterium]|nr:3-isopropylmalate dehydratase small subunit [Verrucomicrobiota bacterium]
MTTFGGSVLWLDRDDINTDEIIPAKYLTEITKQALTPHLLEDLKMDGFTLPASFSAIGAVVTRANFGCGSSREHAPWAFQVNGINLIVARSFARIFRQNTYNSGMLAIELPAADIDTLFTMAATSGGKLHLEADPKTLKLTAKAGKIANTFPFELNPFQQALVLAGGWVNYANQTY